MTAQPLLTLAELGPLSDREQRIHALAYNTGYGDGFDRGFETGVVTVVDADTAPPAVRPRLRLVAS